MAAQGRKNVHGKTGVRFKTGYTASKNKSMLRNVVTDLVLNGEVKVTSGVVKELKPLADHLVTLALREPSESEKKLIEQKQAAKDGKKYAREYQFNMHALRQAASILRPTVTNDKGQTALEVLFKEIAPRVRKSGRKGGYTRSFKLGERRGDSAEVVLVKWAD